MSDPLPRGRMFHARNLPDARPLGLRPACRDDVPRLAEIFLGARDDSMSYLPNFYSTAEIRDWIGNELLVECRITVACLQSVAAGFSVQRGDWLEQLYVHPSHQGQGIGAVLLDQAKRASTGTLRLHVFQQNLRAQAFYKRHGFKVELLRDKFQNAERVADMVCVWRGGA